MPYGIKAGEPVTLALGEDYPELRQSVRRICEKYPGVYWRRLEDEQDYPTEFVDELTKAGFLASLIPEEYGGSGLPLRAAAVILEEINASGCTASQGHAQMYIMGTLLRHGSPEQKEHYLPKIASGELRLQAFGVTEPTTGSDTTKLKTRAVRAGNGDHYLVSGQKVWTSRARQSDLMLLLARTTPVEEVKRRTDGLSVFLVDLRDSLGNGLEIRPIEAMINHNTNEVFFDNLEGSGGEFDRRGGERVPLHPGRDERRAHPRRPGMYRRWALAAQEGDRIRQGTGCVRPSHWAEPGGAVPAGARLCRAGGRRHDLPPRRRAVRCRQGVRRRREHGQAPGLGGDLARRRGDDADLWRVRL